MKVVHLSITEDFGGAARAAYRLHQSLLAAGVDSHMLVHSKIGQDPTVSEWKARSSVMSRVARKIRIEAVKRSFSRYRGTRPKNVECFTDSRAESGYALARDLERYDIINVHWTSGFLDWRLLAAPQFRNKAVVFTLHDMNHFTGGCHYAGECVGFTKNCGRCGQLGSTDEDDLSRSIWQNKRDTLQSRGVRNTQAVGDSRWITAEARRSSLFADVPVRTIHYGIDTSVFRPRDREAIRRCLGIPPDTTAIMFAAASTANPRKGFEFLCRALLGLKERSNVMLLSVGSGSPVIDGISHLHLGQIQNDLFLSLAYNAADVFVIPSVQEAFGLTALEAAACGTPSIGFNTGGIPDLIEDGETGYLVPLRDVSSLQERLLQFIDNPAGRARMRFNSRARAKSLFSFNRQAEEYRSLYAEMRTKSSAAQ